MKTKTPNSLFLGTISEQSTDLLEEDLVIKRKTQSLPSSKEPILFLADIAKTAAHHSLNSQPMQRLSVTDVIEENEKKKFEEEKHQRFRDGLLGCSISLRKTR